jgi:hypothetical protein
VPDTGVVTCTRMDPPAASGNSTTGLMSASPITACERSPRAAAAPSTSPSSSRCRSWRPFPCCIERSDLDLVRVTAREDAQGRRGLGGNVWPGMPSWGTTTRSGLGRSLDLLRAVAGAARPVGSGSALGRPSRRRMGETGRVEGCRMTRGIDRPAHLDQDARARARAHGVMRGEVTRVMASTCGRLPVCGPRCAAPGPSHRRSGGKVLEVIRHARRPLRSLLRTGPWARYPTCLRAAHRTATERPPHDSGDDVISRDMDIIVRASRSIVEGLPGPGPGTQPRSGEKARIINRALGEGAGRRPR